MFHSGFTLIEDSLWIAILTAVEAGHENMEDTVYLVFLNVDVLIDRACNKCNN